MSRPTEMERFVAAFTRGKDDECWKWLLSLSNTGYGQFKNGLDKKNNAAHRYALIISKGSPPFDGAMARHSCDNRWCVNPNHLDWGTRQQNVDDARKRGRIPRGELRPNALLTPQVVKMIRSEFASGVSQKRLGIKFGVSPSTIQSVTDRRSWRHIP